MNGKARKVSFSFELRTLLFRFNGIRERTEIRSARIAQDPQDPGSLERQGFEVVDGWNEPATVIAPETIDWSAAPDRFPYRLRQRPGPANSLGLVKFMFPNRHSVYLHDTPATHRFEARRRAFSHGCVRVEEPAALAAFLLNDPTRWSVDAARGAMHGHRREVVALPSRYRYT